MTFWFEVAAGVLLWVWLLIQLIRPDSFLDKPRTNLCLGCTRHHVISGCPIHDPEHRKTAA